MSGYIFLDFDGVLNSERWYARGRRDSLCTGSAKSIDPAAVGLLNQLIDRSGARIVVSSTWRLAGLHSVRATLAQRGSIGRVVDVTPELGGPRGKEIEWWLRRNAASRIVILDDDSDMGDLLPWLVKTSHQEGITEDHVEAALAILQRDFDAFITGAAAEIERKPGTELPLDRALPFRTVVRERGKFQDEFGVFFRESGWMIRSRPVLIDWWLSGALPEVPDVPEGDGK